MRIASFFVGFYFAFATTAHSQILDRDRREYTDAYQQTYAFSEQAVIRDNSSQGPKKVQFADLRFGELSTLNVHNPLRPVLLFASTNTIVLLDNQFNKTQEINANLLNEQVQLGSAGWANSNQLWIYDQLTHRIGLLDTKQLTLFWLCQPLTREALAREPRLNEFRFIDAQNQSVSMNIYGKITVLETTSRP